MKRILTSLLSCLLMQARKQPRIILHQSDYLWVAVPDHTDWLYQVGERAAVEAQFYKFESIGQNG